MVMKHKNKQTVSRVLNLGRDSLSREESEARDENHVHNLDCRVSERTTDSREAIAKLEQEIKERKRIEGQLRQSEKQFRNIVNSTPAGIHRYKLLDDGRLIFTDANPAAEKILGFDHRPLIGKTIEEAFPAAAQTDIPDRYRRICTSGEPWHSEQVNYEDNRISGWF